MSTISAARLIEVNADAELPEAPTAVDVEQLIRELDAAYNRFPEKALRACQAHRELVIPRLIEVLQHAVRVGQDGAVRVGNAPIYALFLLAEFEATESLPVVMDFLKLPHDIPDELLGESITSDLSRILAIFTGDRPDFLEELIRDPNLNEYVRWSAADAFTYHVRDGHMSRQEAISRLKADLVQAAAQEDAWITGPLIINLLKLNANEARVEMEQAFQKGLVEEFLVNMDCVKDELRPDQPDLCNNLECHTPTKISDTVEEMRDWNWPDADAERKRSLSSEIWPFVGSNQQPSRSLPFAENEISSRYEPSTIRQDSPRVGRNDPCPCGSGKKYKKCCLRKAQEGKNVAML